VEPQTINDVFENQMRAREALLRAEREHYNAQFYYETALARVVNQGKVAGKNEIERNACISGLLYDELAAINEAKNALMAAKSAFDVAVLDTRRVETLVQWMGIE
jgi:hypothetical protein